MKYIKQFENSKIKVKLEDIQDFLGMKPHESSTYILTNQIEQHIKNLTKEKFENFLIQRTGNKYNL